MKRIASLPTWAPDLVRESPLLQEAFEFARWAHHGPRRKDGAGISHPLAVAELLHAEEWPEDVVAAAFLHDVIEDTSTELDEIRDRFGPHVCELVREMTENQSIEDYRRRKAEHRSRVARNRDVAAIYAADKLANARAVDDLGSLPGEKLEHYLATLQVLCDSHPELPFLGELQAELERLRPDYREARSGRGLSAC
jgi:guanosine-3',5'-bis(diphosphate) 3'-pyrophosphohydrolase